MKNLKKNIGKFIILIFLMIAILSVVGGPTTLINTPSSEFLDRNLVLDIKYSELEKKIQELESLTKEIYVYNNLLYSQVLDNNLDTTGIRIDGNDSSNIIFSKYDTIFKSNNKRVLFASEKLTQQLEKLRGNSKEFNKPKTAILYYPTISPIKTKELIKITSPYGWRRHPILRVNLFHEGIDISAEIGSPIYSTAQGTVIKVQYSIYGYGNRVVIKHAYGFETLYAHMGSINIVEGQWVDKNQYIGDVGNSGSTTGPHLHYEIHMNGETRDPLSYFYTYDTEKIFAMK